MKRDGKRRETGGREKKWREENGKQEESKSIKREQNGKLNVEEIEAERKNTGEKREREE